VLWVVIVHVVVVLLLLVLPGARNLFRKKSPVVIPVEFLVATPAPPVPPPPIPVPKPDPKPEPKPEPKPKPKPKPKPRPKIERSTNLVSRTVDPAPKPPQPKLSREEIDRLLAMGATPSDRTSVPGEDARCLEAIRKKLYHAWLQPSVAGVEGLVAQVSIDLKGVGAVRRWQITSPSGRSEFDRSVERAMGAVTFIPGLTSGFVKRHPTVSIAFQVE
jgi:TonB family protein